VGLIPATDSGNVSLLQPPTMNSTAFPSTRGFPVSNRFLANVLMLRTLKTRRRTGVRMKYHGLTGSIPPWTKDEDLPPQKLTDQAAKSRWLWIQRVNHVFALTLIVQCVRRSYVSRHQLV
jgi:hypothetical protein